MPPGPMVQVRPMAISDHAAVLELLSGTPGVTLRAADSLEATVRYLERNPGLSLVAVGEAGVVGCVLCGHDGRRGYLQHLVVAPDYRGRGIGRRLVGRCLGALAALGIQKSHVDVLVTNTGAQAFWAKLGWQKRDDIHRFSFISSGGPDA